MLPVDHIGLAVRDGGAVEALLQQLLNVVPALPKDITSQDVRVRFYGNPPYLEVLEPISKNSTVARYLSKRGEGIHHIAFKVPDAQAQLKHMHAAGFQPLTEEPVEGAGGKRIFFLHPTQTLGILMEFCQPATQYAVQFYSCEELEHIMQSTGHCVPCDTHVEHVVTSGPVPEICRSLVVHNTSVTLSQPPLRAPSVPILISEISTEYHYAQALQNHWSGAQLAILPKESQHKCLPEVLLSFWASLEHE